MMKKLVLIKNNNKISRKIVLGIQFEEIAQNIVMVSKIFIFKEFLVNNIWSLRYAANSVQENRTVTGLFSKLKTEIFLTFKTIFSHLYRKIYYIETSRKDDENG